MDDHKHFDNHFMSNYYGGVGVGPMGHGPPTYNEAMADVVTDPPTQEEIVKEEIANIKRNIGALCFALFLLLTSFNGIGIVESTLNPNSGFISLACLYGTMVTMSLFVSSWLINEISVKWAIFFGMWGYILYSVGQFSPTRNSLIITGIILGVGASPMWIAFSTYMTQAGKKLAVLSNRDPEIMLGQIFAVVHFFGHLSSVAGGLISSIVLAKSVDAPKFTEKEKHTCGMNFCPNNVVDADISSLSPPDTTVVTIYIGSLCGVAIFASYLSGYFVDPLSEFDDREKNNTPEKSGFQIIKSTLGTFCTQRFLLVAVICLWAGVAHSYIIGDFNVAYVACRFGMNMMGYRVMIFPASGALGCVILLVLLKFKGRFPVFIIAGLLNFIGIGVMLVWSTYVDQNFLLYMIPICWGLADSVWQTQIKALLGLIFPDTPEDAFSCLSVFQSIGFILNYVLQPFICNSTKIILMMVILIVGLIGYFSLEYILYRKRNKENNDAEPVASTSQ